MHQEHQGEQQAEGAHEEEQDEEEQEEQGEEQEEQDEEQEQEQEQENLNFPPSRLIMTSSYPGKKRDGRTTGKFIDICLQLNQGTSGFLRH